MINFALRLMMGLVVFTATLLSACSTISSRQTASYPSPPDKAVDVWGRDPVAIDHDLEKRYVADPSNEPLRLLVRYQQAKLWGSKDPAKSCALWMEVIGQPRFPLVHVARIRAMEACPADRGGFPSLEEIVRTTPEPWLKEMLSRSALARAQRIGDKSWEMKLAPEVAAFETLQSEKVRLYKRSLDLAKETKTTAMIGEMQKKLESIAPRFAQDPQPDLFLTVAADFKQAREFDQARKWYRAAVESEALNDWDRLKALDGIRMSYKLEKNTEKFLASTKDYSEFARKKFLKAGLRLAASESSPEQGRPLLSRYFETRIALARAIWTEGAPREAEKLLLDAEGELKSKISTDSSVLIRARIEEEAGRFGDAIRVLSNIKTEKVTDRETKNKVLWLRAWNLRKMKKLKEAAQSFEALLEVDDSQVNLSRNRFWLARTLKDLGQGDEAEKHFEWLMENDALGWYGLLSYRELGRLIPPLKTPAVRSPAAVLSVDKNSALMVEEKLTLEWLVATGESELARKFLDDTTKDRRSSYADEQLLDLFSEYAHAGQYQSLFSKLYDLPASTRKRLLDAHPELLFPQPWATVVSNASSRFDVQTELIYSIMRQESSFNPMARSHADAFGLMQLIPEAAEKARPMTGIELKTHEDLYGPETNIPLGTAFVRGLMNRWKGRYIPTVASYNASEKAIEGWIKSRYRGDPLEFIEDVPYDETKGYIKLVTRNFVFYKRLNSGGAPIPFPEWCLSGLGDAL
jgi:soluble lytic murein transglycosylase